MKKSQKPDRVPVGPALVTPGEILAEEFLKPMELSQSALAEKMGVPRMRVSEIVRGKRAITAETAILLGRALGTSWGGLWARPRASGSISRRRTISRWQP